MKIGIIGLGSVGNAVLMGMTPHYHVTGYDIDGRGEWEDVLQVDAIFVCVPTDQACGHELLNMDAVEDVAKRLFESEYKGLIIYKSTLNVGTMNRLSNTYPGLRLVYMPEFLREKDAVAWFADPDRIVASGKHSDVEQALQIFDWVDSNVPRLPVEYMEAEIGKLAHNAYIATKVTFTCEIERLCILHEVSPHPVMETVWRDRRVQDPAHLTPGLGGFDGKCVPKDTRALAAIDYDTPSHGGLLQHVLELGPKDKVVKAHESAEQSAMRQHDSNLSKTVGKAGDIALNTIGFILCFGIFISYICGLFALGVLYDLPDVEHHIVDINEPAFSYSEHDYYTFSPINASIRSNVTYEELTCWDSSPTYYGSEDDDWGYSRSEEQCEYYTVITPAIISVSNNITFAFTGSEEFFNDCHQSSCLMIGKTRKLTSSYNLFTITEYRDVGGSN